MIQSRNDRISANIFWIISLSTILAVFFSTTVNYYDADAKGSLLVSKAIVEKGTIKLNKLEANNLTEKYGYRVKSRGENIYNYFPLGNQLLAIPVVLAAELIGVNAQEKEEDLQWIMTLITSILIFYLVHDISRRFLDEINSAFFSIVFILGTGLSSTLFTAYWSHNASVTLSLFIIKLIIDSRRNGQLILWPLIAASLFLCYLSRPTTSIMMVISLCLMIYSFKKQSFKPILTLIVMLIGFIAFSFHEFGQPLPDYYMQSLGGEYLMVSLPGNSISPSRGIIVFSPFIPLLIMFFSATNNVSDRLSLMAYGVIWPLIHFLVISSYETWHGGWSFGPRLITDVLPGLLLISLNAWPDLRKFNTREPRFFFLVLSILLAIFINSWQGLHNKSTKEWNAITGFEYDPALVFDWNYPQFAANQNRNLEATIKYRLTEKKINPTRN